MTLLDEITKRNHSEDSFRPLLGVALGDSITHGCFEVSIQTDGKMNCRYDFAKVYPQQFMQRLSALFPQVPMSIINAGISGDNAQNALMRLRRDILPLNPDFIIVCIGLNNIFEGIEGIEPYGQTLEELFSEIKKHNIIGVFMTPNMMNREVDSSITNEELRGIAYRTAQAQNDGVMDLYMKRAALACERQGFPICDCYNRWKRLDECGADVTRMLSNFINHPNREHHAIFSEMLIETLFHGIW